MGKSAELLPNLFTYSRTHLLTGSSGQLHSAKLLPISLFSPFPPVQILLRLIDLNGIVKKEGDPPPAYIPELRVLDQRMPRGREGRWFA